MNLSEDDWLIVILIFGAAFVVISFLIYKGLSSIYPAYFASGQHWKDLTKLGSISLGIIIIGRGIQKHISNWLWIRENEKQRRKESIQQQKETQERQKQLEKERKEKFELQKRLAAEAKERAKCEAEKERKRCQEKEIFNQQVAKLVQFKQKYGVNTLPLNEHFSEEIIKTAKEKVEKEIKKLGHIEILMPGFA
ncbi:hypothetical protein ACFLZN_01375, partial [Nanoarchaeota archaeon]